jgi:hypothetical protein
MVMRVQLSSLLPVLKNKEKLKIAFLVLVGGRYMVSLCVSLGVSNIIMPAQKRLAGISKQMRQASQTSVS